MAAPSNYNCVWYIHLFYSLNTSNCVVHGFVLWFKTRSSWLVCLQYNQTLYRLPILKKKKKKRSLQHVSHSMCATIFRPALVTLFTSPRLIPNREDNRRQSICRQELHISSIYIDKVSWQQYGQTGFSYRHVRNTGFPVREYSIARHPFGYPMI